jgi:hypothetical protein
MSRRPHRQALRANRSILEVSVGFEPTTFRLRVETPSSSRYQPGRFWLLTSAGLSSQYVPDLPSYGRGNDQENDQWAEPSIEKARTPLRADVRPSPPITAGGAILSRA